MNCIICNKIADEVGSHLIPASLIKNCVGKHYSEESYNIDVKTSKIEVYYGRDNLKNESTEIIRNHYKRDNVLCKVCEKKLGILESHFAVEFLQKFRDGKYLNNFISSKSSNNLEILEPKKISNIEIQAYFYSIILRFCCTYKAEEGDSFVEENDLLKIRKFIYNYLYDNLSKENYGIEDFKIIIIFNKYSKNSLLISNLEIVKNPYTFYFCEAIIVLYIGETPCKEKSIYADCLNSITDESSKIIVGPASLYDELTVLKTYILGRNFMTKGIKNISELNKKSYKENEIEVREMIKMYEGRDDKGLYIDKIFNDLTTKYSR
ncbi:hypothetical protein NTJ12_002052 [Flavobacterium psychrophilum]|nr:hypothetical protein [Flavobacterium psychrophilum]